MEIPINGLKRKIIIDSLLYIAHVIRNITGNIKG
jgi:hypothetical protein